MLVYCRVNTISGSIRLVSNIALALFNTIKALVYTACGIGQWLFSQETKCLDYAGDSMDALKVNVAACTFAIFESIPIIGNLPYWCFIAVIYLVAKKCKEVSDKPYYGFFEYLDKVKTS